MALKQAQLRKNEKGVIYGQKVLLEEALVEAGRNGTKALANHSFAPTGNFKKNGRFLITSTTIF